MIELLSGRQLSERFPLPVPQQDGTLAWYMLLSKWREGKLLKQREHYRQLPENGRLCYVYVPAKVVALICLEATKSEHPRPRISYLYETYYTQFCEILTTRAFTIPAVNAINEQGKTSNS